MQKIYKALASFNNEVPVIHEDTKGFNYTYANLNTIFETIKPLLSKHGLSFTQLLDGNKLKTVLFHVESGETIESSVDIETDVKLASMNHYQVFGSAITYFRRYSLACMLGLITDKDVDSTGDRVEKPAKEVKKPKLTTEDYAKALKCKPGQIETVLSKYDLTEDQIKMLTKAKGETK